LLILLVLLFLPFLLLLVVVSIQARKLSSNLSKQQERDLPASELPRTVQDQAQSAGEYLQQEVGGCRIGRRIPLSEITNKK
jgi:hypothetical protein